MTGFKNLKVPLINGNKKQKEQAENEANFERQEHIALIEHFLKRGSIVVPFIDESFIKSPDGKVRLIGTVARFCITRLDEQTREELQSILNKKSGIKELKITKKGEKPINNIV